VVSGSLLGVTNFYKTYTIRTDMLASNGLNLAQVRFINFVVDGALAGVGNEIGQFAVRAFALAQPALLPAGQGSGSATLLPSNLPARVDNVGGGNGTNWVQNGTTNVVSTYNVTSGGYDGFIIRYEDFVQPGNQSGDFGGTPNITFGISGNPSSLKIEFKDDLGFQVNATVTGITGSTKWYTVKASDLEDAGLDVRHIQFVNFIVDQGLAGAGNFSGSFSVVTAGLAP
jgi:hypothetical protein